MQEQLLNNYDRETSHIAHQFDYDMSSMENSFQQKMVQDLNVTRGQFDTIMKASGYTVAKRDALKNLLANTYASQANNMQVYADTMNNSLARYKDEHQMAMDIRNADRADAQLAQQSAQYKETMDYNKTKSAQDNYATLK
jgi:hypothetical protein